MDTSNVIYLEYGDVIQIFSPLNDNLHEHTYFIYYIDNTKIRVAHISNFQTEILYLNEDGTSFRDESITEIHILSKSNEKGWIAQNKLNIGNWIDIHFSGELPTILTGQVSNIEEDQMELTLFPNFEIIYIDFAYKGIPENIPIQKIVIRSQPETYKPPQLNITQMNVDNIEQTIEPPELNSFSPEQAEDVFNENIRDKLHELYINANEIFFDNENVEYVSQVIELDANKKIYGIEEQISNLLDELLSTIPNLQRTPNVLNNIHRLIERFKQLRHEFLNKPKTHILKNKKKPFSIEKGFSKTII
jgi:hypothetical protein